MLNLIKPRLTSFSSKCSTYYGSRDGQKWRAACGTALPPRYRSISLALPAAADTLSYLSSRCAAALHLLLPSFVKETRRRSERLTVPIHSMLAFADANGISIRSLSSSLSSLFRSFIRRRRVTIISTFGYRFCALHPPFLALSPALSPCISSSFFGRDRRIRPNHRRTAAFSDNRERKLHLLFLDLERNPQPETRETATYSFYKHD